MKIQTAYKMVCESKIRNGVEYGDEMRYGNKHTRCVIPFVRN